MRQFENSIGGIYGKYQIVGERKIPGSFAASPPQTQ